MSLEIMQMRLNNAADKFKCLSQEARYSANHSNENIERDLYEAIADVYQNISDTLKEEMKIEHY